MSSYETEFSRARDKRQRALPYVEEIGEAISEVLDAGKRGEAASQEGRNDAAKDSETFRVRGGPTRSERMNRALKELGPSAFKIHQLLWTWRGAPAKGNLPFFTVHSLARFCRLSRPTVRSGLNELILKGWIAPGDYNVHHKNTLFRLVPIRHIPFSL